MTSKKAVNSQDIKVDNARHRDFVLSSGAYLLAKSKRLLWYLETLVLSARFQQLLQSVNWGNHSQRFNDRYQLWNKQMIPRIEVGAEIFEFGVAAGTATKWWANKNLKLHKWHGFDTFTGLPSPWTRGGVEVMEAGVFDQSVASKEFPQIVSGYEVIWHKGLISDTLKSGTVEVDRKRQTIIFIDVDLYEPTKEILIFFGGKLKNGDLVYFDEGFDPWNEGLALRECLEILPKFRAIAHTGSALLIKVGES